MIPRYCDGGIRVPMGVIERASDSVAAGRDYVAAYVDYIHFVESAHCLAAHGASPRHAEPAAHAK